MYKKTSPFVETSERLKCSMNYLTESESKINVYFIMYVGIF